VIDADRMFCLPISVHALWLMVGRHFAMPLRCVKTGLYAD